MADKVLSASRIKVLQQCSWIYHCKYVLKLPDTQNSGSMRGTCAHLVFECLMNPRHKKHVATLLEADDIKAVPSINRLVIKHLAKCGIYDDENYTMMNEMILVGLKNDFFCDGGKLLDPEFEFVVDNEEPRYKVMGFIDKAAQFDDGRFVITDYKSSKKKFVGEDLKSNVQAMIYSLAALKKWPGVTPSVNFLFLRFPKKPLQSLAFNQAELDGFEYYLERLYKVINNFNEDEATANFAADDKEHSWLCGRGSWVCPFKNGFKYFVSVKDGEIKKSSFANDLVPKEGETIEERTYEGCPRFKIGGPRAQTQDFF